LSKTTKAEASLEAQEKKPERVDAPTFEKEDLIRAANSVFGVQPEVLLVALKGVEAPITETEAKEKLQEYLARPVGA
jgi:hypothetical protein